MFKRGWVLIVLATFCCCLAETTAQASDGWQESQKFWPSDVGQRDRFGNDVAVSADGTVLVVGSPNLEGTSRQGRAHVYNRINKEWLNTAVLEATFGDVRDLFGTSVSISGDGERIIIGAPGEDDNRGAAYLFEYNLGTWIFTERITNTESDEDDQFGACTVVSSDGKTLLITATGANEASFYRLSGSSEWDHETTAHGQPRNHEAQFGIDAALSHDGTLAVIGEPYNTEWGIDGSIHVFERNEDEDDEIWSRIFQEFPTLGGAQPTEFGKSVAMSGDGSVIFVGAPLTWYERGAAYLYTRNGDDWDLEETFVPDGSGVGDQVGGGVAISADSRHAIIGAPGTDGSHADVGAAFAVKRTRGGIWKVYQYFAGVFPTVEGRFGQVITMSHDGLSAVIGSPFNDAGNWLSGATYAFDWSDGSLSARIKRFIVTAGEHIEGDKPTLVRSDDEHLRMQSVYANESNGENRLALKLVLKNRHARPRIMSITLESNINHPVGIAEVYLQNWRSKAWVLVGEYAIGLVEDTVKIEGLNPDRYINKNNDRIKMIVKQKLVNSFSTDDFESQIDLIEVLIR